METGGSCKENGHLILKNGIIQTSHNSYWYVQEGGMIAWPGNIVCWIYGWWLGGGGARVEHTQPLLRTYRKPKQHSNTFTTWNYSEILCPQDI